MVDIETDIIDMLVTAMSTAHPEATVLSGYVQNFADFPAVVVEEVENTTDKYTMHQSGELLSRVTFDINIYSNANPGKRQQTRDIAVSVDDAMLKAGFRCTWSQTVPDFYDTTIYRITRRYVAKVGKDKTIYRG